MTRKEILERLNEVTKSISYINILCEIVIRDFCGPIDILFSQNNMEHLNHKEFTFLIGLWLKNIDSKVVFDDKKHNEIFVEVYQLMEKLHYTFLKDFKFDPKVKVDLYEYFTNGNMFQETMFYSGSGAYDNQYKDTAILKYKYDREWILENKKFEVNSLSKFYENIKIKLQEKLNSRNLNKNISEKEQILNLFCLKKDEIITDNPDFSFILDALSVNIHESNNQSFNELGDFNIYSEKPILKIDDNTFFIPSCFALSESIYESPFYWMQNDKKYLSKAQNNRGKVAEEITKKILEPVFGTSNIYQNIIINKTKNNQVGEIDILAFHFHKAIIFQIKSKKLTELSKNGNLESIKNDFTKAVQNAYEQGISCRSYLNDYQNYKFPFENENFINRIGKILEYYIVTIVLDDYPAITHQVHILLGNKTTELPVAINIFDLELIAKYLPKPEKFIDYISKRIKYSKSYKADNEMGYLGFHLSKGLNKPEADYIALDTSWAQSIDRKYYNELHNVKKENINTKKTQRNDPCFCNSGMKYKKCHGKQ
jgi:hypothetical protein